PSADSLLDDLLETTDEALIDELMTSGGSGVLEANEAQVEESIEQVSEPDQTPSSDIQEALPEETASPVEENDELDIESLLSENSDVEEPAFTELEQKALELKATDTQD
ncbi:hypothetical protein, partial [Vibrio cyclitrophicus]|uniref:hypothetical protein n=1 Tax=Vibrio cyclitrophicus TaxID=47951 RepID=UPI0011B55810